MLDNIDGYKGLMSAVITRAISDSLIQLKEKGKMSPLANDAFRFLFSDDIDLYLEFLDIDPKYFKTHLVNNMFNDSDDVGLHPTKKWMFRINYKKYMQKQAKKAVMAATYKPTRKCKKI